jgi:hypothetical protein
VSVPGLLTPVVFEADGNYYKEQQPAENHGQQSSQKLYFTGRGVNPPPSVLIACFDIPSMSVAPARGLPIILQTFSAGVIAKRPLQPRGLSAHTALGPLPHSFFVNIRYTYL